MNLFLVGLPGSGKSTIGKGLSELTGYPYIDTDDLIIGKEKKSIEAIFKDHGEDYFRMCEQHMLKEVIKENNSIISTGGGLPCFFDNMNVINANGISIFLNVPPATIVERLWTVENQNRPLLKGKNKAQLLEFLEAKLNERRAYYKRAALIVEGDAISAQEIYSRLKSEKSF